MDYYDEISEGYDELYEGEQLKKLSIIADKIKIPKDNRLLDVGCGTGISTRFFECDRTGVDPSRKMVEIAKQKDPEGKYIVAQAENLPFEDDSFGFVVSVTAVHNFKNVEKGLREIKRVAKDGHENIVLTVLRKSKNFEETEKLIMKNFRLKEIALDSKDAIFFLEK